MLHRHSNVHRCSALPTMIHREVSGRPNMLSDTNDIIYGRTLSNMAITASRRRQWDVVSFNYSTLRWRAELLHIAVISVVVACVAAAAADGRR